eukprot:CAMPEP_0169280918 /NCGR_PEP_ID=MMETSP1016-20121227/55911_1 /TAXON_ID=342587 /ORGANISM="Karlodinium micrum, Strain CCMP2283" /LENGTH=166 /DNA_ID=CAMNT_0009369371 /DNA_START=303 /DNA_END=803 /DNA_ORIENTATION=-
MKESSSVDILHGFPDSFREAISAQHATGDLWPELKKRYAEAHEVKDDAKLFEYVQDMKRKYMKSSKPLTKICFCDKIATVYNALGVQATSVRIQGKKLKSKNELRVCSVFKKLPADFLLMIVAHELAHLRHKEHDKRFYQLASHMDPDYMQHEVDLRVWLWAMANT